jgi:hypothetical protein
MATRNQNKSRLELIITRDDAKKRIADQIEKARAVPNASINENGDARRWYEFTAELLRQIGTTDELADEFTGKGSISFGNVDITTGRYLRTLLSIYERVELYPERKNAEPNHYLDTSAKLGLVAARFHAVTRQLRKRYDDRTTLSVDDEYDVQDLFHALLHLFFDDIRREEWAPSYAGGSARIDFLLKQERTVVEIKKTRNRLGTKELREQIAVDLLQYRAHPECKALFCFVYDPEERIINPRGVEADLSQVIGELKVNVVVTQR